jgi:hypothetical protein
MHSAIHTQLIETMAFNRRSHGRKPPDGGSRPTFALPHALHHPDSVELATGSDPSVQFLSLDSSEGYFGEKVAVSV